MGSGQAGASRDRGGGGGIREGYLGVGGKVGAAGRGGLWISGRGGRRGRRGRDVRPDRCVRCGPRTRQDLRWVLKEAAGGLPGGVVKVDVNLPDARDPPTTVGWGRARRESAMPTIRGVLRLGELLKARGALTEAQVQEILETQKRRGRPFGDLAERMFGVRPEVVEDAWAEQYAQMADHVDAMRLRPEPEALRLIEGDLAREFGVLPVEINGDEVMVCTTAENLARALRFVGWRIGKPAYFVIADGEKLERAIARSYAA